MLVEARDSAMNERRRPSSRQGRSIGRIITLVKRIPEKCVVNNYWLLTAVIDSALRSDRALNSTWFVFGCAGR
jgi:hypothetical protein